MDARLWIGTSSWADKALIASGRFYPDELKDTPSRLAYYAERFNLGEVDSTYYALPSRKNIERWSGSVPNGFRFIVKAFALHTQHPTQLKSIPKSFHDALSEDARKKSRVYEKDLPAEVSDELWRIFLAALGPMRDSGKLGAVLIDFPPWFVPSKANREHVIHARERVPDDPVIVEFRNRLWVSDDESTAMTFDLLRELKCGFVCVDEPPGLDSSFPPVAGVTAPIAAVRLRGRNAERWEDRKARTEEKLNWWYTDEELSEWVPRIEQLAAEAEDVYITFNTKAEDQSVVNAARLQRLLS
ncbi:MAG: DUF72 domain-containing protein [Dehalococcoidia bacterium]